MFIITLEYLPKPQVWNAIATKGSIKFNQCAGKKYEAIDFVKSMVKLYGYEQATFQVIE